MQDIFITICNLCTLQCSRYNDYGMGQTTQCSTPGRQGQEIPLPPQNSKPVLGFTQPPTQYALGVPFPVLKRPGHEFDHPIPPSVEVKNK
jgi:hypothetical protein